MLTSASLRKDADLLARLKEQLFKLWGDLEEQKSAAQRLQSKKADMPPPSSFESSTRSVLPRIGQQPDVDTDSESEGSVSKSSKSKTTKSSTNEMGDACPPPPGVSSDEQSTLKPRNKAFTCCIQQYGVKVYEEDPAKANAGEGRRWQRVFALFGTSIW